MMLTFDDARQLGREIVHNPRIVPFVAIAVVRNTVRAGWDAPQRWYGFFRGKPYWRYLRQPGASSYSSNK